VRPVRNVNLHIAKLTLFNLLSGADLLLTWRLIRRGQGLVYECNPIASAWLSSFGWAGLVAFKLAMMATIGFLAILISVRHPKVSGRILLFGCLVTAAVVIYSCYLTHLIGVEFADIWDDDTRALDDSDFLFDLQRRESHRQLLAQLRGRLIDGRSSLDQAVAELEGFKDVPNPPWLRVYEERCPGLSHREYLAQHLLYHTMAELTLSSAEATRFSARVQGQYQAAFGRPLPVPLPRISNIQIAAKKE
jgi:hypothetical protein